MVGVVCYQLSTTAWRRTCFYWILQQSLVHLLVTMPFMAHGWREKIPCLLGIPISSSDRANPAKSTCSYANMRRWRCLASAAELLVFRSGLILETQHSTPFNISDIKLIIFESFKKCFRGVTFRPPKKQDTRSATRVITHFTHSSSSSKAKALFSINTKMSNSLHIGFIS